MNFDMKSVHDLTEDEALSELEQLTLQHGFVRPTRSNVGETRRWKNGPPNYDKADLLFFQGKTKNHAEGSLESVVENAVKTWEMEATHLEFKDWSCIDHSQYRVSANAAKTYVGEEAARAGNYNWLLEGVDKSLYDNEKESFESSHELFRGAFLGGFPWELLEVFSPPPVVSFSWRHWAKFEGTFQGREGDGKLYEMYGFGILKLTEQLKITEIQIYYKPAEFMKAMHGEIAPETLASGMSLLGSGCPVLSRAN